ncbi:hypothetical protein SH1V18_32310 [Vallitalea longa]|uniref:Uncharacterized protein n=1 Tax=Vallitalea longa TaxID=2936439 RepID=A0A9W6DF10_9FIRM|nr:hypothetical protein [Vallitalea longa]GKX30751.1 hypothetical protein SH1V18_32310 [Vallitalea longa]
MEELTLARIKNDVIQIVKRCGIAIYIVEFIKCIFNSYNTYQAYIAYFSNDTVGQLSQSIYNLLGIVITAVLSIISILIIDNSYEKINDNYPNIIKNSFKKLPKYILGYIVVGSFIIVALLICMVTIIALRGTLGTLVIIIFIILFLYIMIRFCLLSYVLILEEGTNFISRSKELYLIDKSIMVKYYFATLIIQIIPTVLLTSLPNWMNIELSKTAFLSTRIGLIVIGLVLAPIIKIVGLSIYKCYIDEDLKY